MIDEVATKLALRNRALDLIVATTGTLTLAATSKGYARTVGSFVADRFMVGQELLPVGFSANSPDVITSVTDSEIKTSQSHPVQGAGASRALTVGLPSIRAWEDTVELDANGNPKNRKVGLHYLTEEFSISGATTVTYRKHQQLGLYVLSWYGVSGYAADGVRQCVAALKARYNTGTQLAIGDGRVYCGMPTSPQASEPIPQDGGWVVMQLQIPLLARSTYSASI